MGNIDGKSSVTDNDFWVRVYFAEVGWEIDDYPDAVVPEQDDNKRCPMYSVEWSFFMKKYFTGI